MKPEMTSRKLPLRQLRPHLLQRRPQPPHPQKCRLHSHPLLQLRPLLRLRLLQPRQRRLRLNRRLPPHLLLPRPRRLRQPRLPKQRPHVKKPSVLLLLRSRRSNSLLS